MNRRLRMIRIDQDMNMTRFAEALGVTQGTISMWESGSRNISNQTVKLISRVFNVSEKWLTDGEGEMYLPKTKAMKAAEIADRYVHKNSAVKNEILDIVSEMDESLIRILVAEARRIVSVADEAEKDQE